MFFLSVHYFCLVYIQNLNILLCVCLTLLFFTIQRNALTGIYTADPSGRAV